MIRLSNMRLPINYNDEDIRKICAKELRISPKNIEKASLYKRSIDARHKNDIHYVSQIEVFLNTNEKNIISKCKSAKAAISEKYNYEPVSPGDKSIKPLIIGMGPAGLFCALIMCQSGIEPIVIDRGSSVDIRTKKVNEFWNNRNLDTECNVQFGEGGAGTFSDGKLNTGTKDTRARKVLEEFVHYGAPYEILYNAKPHIGTDKLKATIKNLRLDLEKMGAKIMFDTKLININCNNNKVQSAVLMQNSKEITIECSHLILATGHSSRDTFEMLYNMGISMEDKAFSVGARIEHLREKIDFAQYGNLSKQLPAADYKESVHLKDGRGVYTFCMCPGGVVVASQSEKNSVVTNGMSYFKRDNINSNSALLVAVNPDDIKSNKKLKGMYFQRELEKKAFIFGGEDYSAPVQKVGDFLKNQKSKSFGNILPTYRPNVKFAKMDDILPAFVVHGMRQAIPLIDKKLHGFADSDAILTAVESRSSSPIRILRNRDMQSVSIQNLYPCGEGAGYAGGIISAAVDGIKCAEQILLSTKK